MVVESMSNPLKLFSFLLIFGHITYNFGTVKVYVSQKLQMGNNVIYPRNFYYYDEKTNSQVEKLPFEKVITDSTIVQGTKVTGNELQINPIYGILVINFIEGNLNTVFHPSLTLTGQI